MDVYLFPILKKGEGEATFHEGREENLHLGIKVDNFHMSQRLLSIMMIVLGALAVIYGNFGFTIIGKNVNRMENSIEDMRVYFSLNRPI